MTFGHRYDRDYFDADPDRHTPLDYDDAADDDLLDLDTEPSSLTGRYRRNTRG